MCGICGTAGFADRDTLARMTQALRHRGPDDEGYYVEDGIAGLGMRRLSIIDLPGGHQPMSDERQRYRLVFNGEIYNHVSLRRELEAKGHRFASQADTEVIVHLYEDHQAGCVEQLEGDFAFAVWDSSSKELFLARDRMGVKPLYYWHQGGRFAFASELKALVALPQVPRELDLDALDAYLTFLYIPSPRSIFKGIRKLPAGCSLTLKDGAVRVSRYWDLDSRVRGPLVPKAQWVDAIAARLRESVKARLMSEVPLGAFLSGGIDSSSVVALMRDIVRGPVSTFSIGFEGSHGSFNELPSARLAAGAFGTDHHEIIVNPDVAAILPDVVRHLDEPFANSSSLLMFLISREARRHVTVALSGTGGDELFGGYPRYVGAWASQSYARLPRGARAAADALARALPVSAASGAGRLQRFTEGARLSPAQRYLHWISFFHLGDKQSLYAGDLRGALRADPYAGHEHILRAPGEYLDRVNRMDLETYLPDDLLMLSDKMSMAHGLEVRVPFCDHRLVELAASIPMKERMRGFQMKRLLKQAVKPLLPPALLRKRKQGFMVPLGQWLREDLRPLSQDLLAEDTIRARGWFSPGAVTALKDRQARGEANLTHQLYALLVLELWCREYLDPRR